MVHCRSGDIFGKQTRLICVRYVGAFSCLRLYWRITKKSDIRRRIASSTAIPVAKSAKTWRRTKDIWSLIRLCEVEFAMSVVKDSKIYLICINTNNSISPANLSAFAVTRLHIRTDWEIIKLAALKDYLVNNRIQKIDLKGMNMDKSFRIRWWLIKPWDLKRKRPGCLLRTHSEN